MRTNYKQAHQAFKKVRIPANMDGTECFIDIEVVEEKILLLLSKHS